MFNRAFIDSRNDPQLRPGTENWYHTLFNLLQNDLTDCQVNAKHQYYKSLKECPYCKADDQHMIAQGEMHPYPPPPPLPPDPPPPTPPFKRALIAACTFVGVVFLTIVVLIINNTGNVGPTPPAATPGTVTNTPAQTQTDPVTPQSDPTPTPTDPTPSPTPSPTPTPTPTPSPPPGRVNVENVADEVSTIISLWNESRSLIESDSVERIVENGMTTFYINERMRRVDIAKDINWIPYMRMYLFYDGQIIFAYFGDRDNDDHRFYFKNGQMFRWRHSPVSGGTERVDYDNRYDLPAFLNWEQLVLQDLDELGIR